jgi:hypothetical protein
MRHVNLFTNETCYPLRHVTYLTSETCYPLPVDPTAVLDRPLDNTNQLTQNWKAQLKELEKTAYTELVVAFIHLFHT